MTTVPNAKFRMRVKLQIASAGVAACFMSRPDCSSFLSRRLDDQTVGSTLKRQRVLPFTVEATWQPLSQVQLGTQQASSVLLVTVDVKTSIGMIAWARTPSSCSPANRAHERAQHGALRTATLQIVIQVSRYANDTVSCIQQAASGKVCYGCPRVKPSGSGRASANHHRL